MTIVQRVGTLRRGTEEMIGVTQLAPVSISIVSLQVLQAS